MSVSTLLSTALHPQNWPTSIWVLLLTGVAYAVGFLAYRPSFPRNAPKLLTGYGALFNATPKIEVSPDQSVEEDFAAKFNRLIVRLLRKEQLCKRLHLLVRDTHDTTKRLAGRSTKISDPFEDMYRLVFQLTMRMVGCDEIAEDDALLVKTLRIFEGIDAASTATKVMFPWMPTIGHFRRVYSGAQMYMILERVIKERKARGVDGSDALQYLTDEGYTTVEMVAFIFAKLETFVATAIFVAKFDYHLCDADENRMDKVPEDSVDRNTHSASKPRNNLYLKYTERTRWAKA
ncbi:Sterol 14-demethylase [Colletotrichum sp. SAR11_240]|nr:Sterol 14-demethylase [Colletotrichum sp. SAR11_240]